MNIRLEIVALVMSSFLFGGSSAAEISDESGGELLAYDAEAILKGLEREKQKEIDVEERPRLELIQGGKESDDA